MSMRRARLRVTSQKMKEVLDLPYGVRVVGAGWDHNVHAVVLYLEGDELPETMEGEVPLYVSRQVTLT